MRELALVVGTVAFAAVHLLWYCRVVAYRLWELSGGIQHNGRWTTFGTSDWAWTTPVHLPAGLLFHTGCLGLGLPLLFVGSLVAGFAAAGLFLSVRDRPALGAWRWRLWLFLAGWVWLPIPATASWVYQWTVVY